MFTVLLILAVVFLIIGAVTTAKWLLIFAVVVAVVGLATRNRVP